jgi:hypothetical protein
VGRHRAGIRVLPRHGGCGDLRALNQRSPHLCG